MKTETQTVKQLKELPGLIACTLEHEVTKTQARVKWNGPKLNTVWPSVLAFFKWAYDEHHAEAQVRMYANHTTRRWVAWAYPQEVSGGTTKEIINDKAKEQRSMFDDQWVYFSTAHSHGSMGAFQSGTDYEDEKAQDGLHITVGNLDKEVYSLHSRLYISGYEINPNMSLFWDVEPLLNRIPQSVRKYLANDMEHKLAYEQMVIPASPGTVFPNQWKENVIPVKRPEIIHINSGGNYNYGSGGRGYVKKAWDLARDTKIAAVEWEDICKKYKVKGDPSQVLAKLRSQGLMVELTQLLYRNDVSLEGLSKEMNGNGQTTEKQGMLPQ